MLTVFCVYWGDKYPKAYVYALQAAVNKYLTVDHRFVCVTTDKFEGVTTRNPAVPYHGWWQKIGLFHPGVATGPSIYFDLDVVITGSLNYLTDYTDQFSAPANWANSGHGGIQSSVMAWPGKWHVPFNAFKPQWPEISQKLWGDQEFLTELLGDDWVNLPGVCSYKYHVRPTQTITDDMRVVCFHGKPDPDEVTDKCLLPYTQTLHFLSKQGTPSISGEALKHTG